MSKDTADLGQKIAILLPDLSGGGVERMRVMKSRSWLARGFEVDFVLLRKQGELLEIVPQEAQVISLGAELFRNALWPLCAYLRQHRPSVLLVAMWPLTVIAILAHRLAGQPGRVIVSDHSVLSLLPEAQGWRKRFLMRASIALTYPLAHHRVAVSKGVADNMARLGWLSRQKITVIYNPAARGYLPTTNNIPELWGSLQGKRVISVGTLKSEKNHAY